MSETTDKAWWQASGAAFITITLFALIWRVATFGNPTLHVDDQFYAMVGQQMHSGLLPYVDIWDRKPFGLFLIYYAIAAVSFDPVAYQIAAWLAVSATGWVIYLCCRHWAAGTGSVFAGLLYVAALNITGGEGGQAPVFYNLLVALAVLAIIRWLERDQGRADRNIWLAMVCLGLALTIKQTVMFEAAAIGVFVLYRMYRAGAVPLAILRTAFVSALFGMAPTLACLAFFYASGHLDVFWHAMILSNMQKVYPDLAVMGARALLALLGVTPMLVPMLVSFIGPAGRMARFRPFLLTWLAAALVGFRSVPNFYLHYVLPLWLPICILGSRALDRRWIGPLIGLGCITYSALHTNPFKFEWTQRSRDEVQAAAEMINRLDDGETMLVFEGPPVLYEMTDRRFLSPLVFPTHLSWQSERDVSHLQTTEEVRRILQQRPDVIVTLPRPRTDPANAETWALVQDYARTQCTWQRRMIIPEIYHRWRTDVFGGCGAD